MTSACPSPMEDSIANRLSVLSDGVWDPWEEKGARFGTGDVSPEAVKAV